MLEKFFKNYVYPIVTLVGGVIGVGFLSLPYITLKVGIWPMLFYFVVLTALMVFIHVIFAKISLKTPDHKRFPGFVEFYLGKKAKMVTLVMTLFGGMGILLVYLLVGSQFLANMLGPFFGGSTMFYLLIYFIAASGIIFFGIKAISKLELWSLLILFVAFFAICIAEFSKIRFDYIFLNNTHFLSDWRIIFLPYGALLFSLWGTGLIPETEEMLVGNKKIFKKVVVLATFVPTIIYLVFIFLVLGISGGRTTDSALIGLKGFLSPMMFLVALSIGFVSTFTAFVTQGLILKKTLMYDMRIKESSAWILTCAPPLALLLFGFTSVIFLISFLGGVVGGIEGILILLMYKKIGGKNAVIYPLSLVFILGMVYQIVYFIK